MQFTSSNGATIWYESDSANAGLRAMKDVRLTDQGPSSMAMTGDRQTDPPPPPPMPASRAMLVSAGAGLVNASVATANLAINIASLIAGKADTGDTAASLEIEISNSSNSAVVVYAIDPDKGNVSKLPPPIGKDASDVVLLTRPNGFNDNETKVAISMLVYGVDVIATYSLVSVGSGTPEPMRWNVTLSIDGVEQSFTPSNSLVAATYVKSTSGTTTRFSIYTTGLTSQTGQIELSVFDTELAAAAGDSLASNGGAGIDFLDNARTAAMRAAADVEAFQTPPTSSSANTNDMQGTREIIPAAAVGILTAVFSTVAAAANIGNAGFAIASLFGGDPKTSESFEIELSNFSSQPVVVYGVTTGRTADRIGRLPTPLALGESDVILMVGTEGFAQRKSDSSSNPTKITVQLLVGAVPVELVYVWTDAGDPGRWVIQASANGSAQHSFSADLKLVAIDFDGTTTTTAATGTAPGTRTGAAKQGAFRLYTMPIETGTGQIDIAIYDRSS